MPRPPIATYDISFDHHYHYQPSFYDATAKAIVREYLRYTPYRPQPHNTSEPSPDSPTPTNQPCEYIPYNTQFQQISSIPSEKLAIDEEYTSFLPLWAELSITEKDPVYSTCITTNNDTTPKPTERKTSAYLPRFQAPTQPTKKESEYGNFFCKECGCPLADRYGLHDLDDDDDWKEEYEVCPMNVQTREWARSLELLRLTEETSKTVMGKERRRPRNLPRIDTGVSNRYRTGLQHLA